MTIIKIDPGKNGYHDNQTIYGDIPNSWIPTGWALIPEELGTPETLENYPFGEITVEEIGGIPTVTSWTPLPVPDPVPEPVPESYTSEDLLSALLGLEASGNAGGGDFVKP